MPLQYGEEISDYLHPEFNKLDESCSKCGAVCYRVLVISDTGGQTRRLSLCAKHFIEALHKYPGMNSRPASRAN